MKLHLPLNHKPQKKPRRKLITTEIGTQQLFISDIRQKQCLGLEHSISYHDCRLCLAMEIDL